MTKPGNWGNWAVIEKTKAKKPKKITCEMCTSYSTSKKTCKYEEFNCVKDSWKKCDHFYFKSQYDTARYWDELVKEKRGAK